MAIFTGVTFFACNDDEKEMDCQCNMSCECGEIIESNVEEKNVKIEKNYLFDSDSEYYFLDNKLICNSNKVEYLLEAKDSIFADITYNVRYYGIPSDINCSNDVQLHAMPVTTIEILTIKNIRR